MSQRPSTPLIALGRFAPAVPLFVKAEHLRVTGSVFDRMAPALVEAQRPEIEARGRAVFAGSGSACLALASALAPVRAEVTAVVSRGALPEHRDLLGRHRVSVATSDADQGLLGTHATALELARAQGGVLLYTPLAEGGAERAFAESLSDDLAATLAAVAQASGTVTAVVPHVSRALLSAIASASRSSGFEAQLVATVVPDRALGSLQDDVFSLASAPVLPGVEIVAVADAEAGETRAELARTEGLLVGLSSAAAARVARARAVKGPTLFFSLDAGDRYFSVDRGLKRAGGGS